jgi:signal transduction histidine kinase
MARRAVEDLNKRIKIEETTRRRTLMVETLNKTLETFISYHDEPFDDVMTKGIHPIADTMGIDRVSVYRYRDTEKGRRLGATYIWDRFLGGTVSVPEDENLAFLPDIECVKNWLAALKNNQTIYIRTSDLLGEAAEFLGRFGVKLIFMAPIFAYGEFWGVISLQDHTRDELFESGTMEAQMLEVTTGLLAKTIIRAEAEQAMVEAVIKAQEASRAKGDFLSRMSHEMRSPMNVIMGMTQIAKISNYPQKTISALNKIDEASRKLLQLIDNVLDITRMEYDTLKLVESAFDFNEMIREIIQMTSQHFSEKQLEFTYDVSPLIPSSLTGDKRRIKQVIDTLLGNAIKFTPENGKVHLSIRAQEINGGSITLEIEITDTGIGIPAEKQNDLFEIFEQADGGLTRKHGGIGIGLALSKRIIEMMGGVILLESEPGAGTKFVFTCKMKLLQN